MSDLFERLKQEIDLEAHLVKFAPGSKIIKLGDGKKRVNPCPLPGCGHNDCFTIYKDGSYSCFSCKGGGDIINLERTLAGHADNKSAADALVSQYGINLDDPPKPKPRPETQNEPPPPPEIDPERATALREFIIDFFHQRLLGDKAALAYQLNIRKHALESVRKYKIGVCSGPLIQAALDAGYTREDLSAISLLSRRGRGYSRFVKPSHFIYPHYVDGKIAFATIKDSSKLTDYNLKKINIGPGWYCWGQDAIKNDVIYMVEGEDDRITTEEKCNLGDQVIAICGNFNMNHIPFWIAENARDKTFYLLFDNDKAGHGYTKKIGHAITTGGGKAYVTDLSQYVDAEGRQQDIDDILKNAADPRAEFNKIIAAAKPFTPADQPLASKSSLHEFQNFRVLGVDQDNKMVLWSTITRRIYYCEIEKLSYHVLNSIGGPEISERVVRTQKEAEAKGLIVFGSLKSAIINEAILKPLMINDRLGQGLHWFDWPGRFFIVCGPRAWTYNGTEFTEFTDPIYNSDYLVDYLPGGEWCESFESIIALTSSMTPAKAKKIFEELAEIISQWSFTGSKDRVLLCGWILAQMVQTAWIWRPHLWVSGSQESGKTILTQLVEQLGGGLAKRHEGQGLSEPGLRQDIGYSSVHVIIDEFEKSEQRAKIIEMLRSAGRGGVITKGSSSQKGAISYRVKYMALLCSIETGLSRAAEKNRYLIIQTKKDKSLSPEILTPEAAAEMQTKLMAYALWAVWRARKAIKGLARGKREDRLMSSVAVPMSMVAAACDDEKVIPELQKMTEGYIEEQDRIGSALLEDEFAIAEAILSAQIKIPDIFTQEGPHQDRTTTIYIDRAISQLLAESEMLQAHDEILQSWGIRDLPAEEAIAIHPETAEKLLRGSMWANLKIRDILRRLPGGKDAQRKIAKRNTKVLVIPYSTLGIEKNNKEEIDI